MINKGRKVSSPGEKNGWAVLTENDVRAIRKRYIPRSRTHGVIVLAKEYGVSVSCINAVVRNKRWKHVN
jgi:ribosomal protein S25